MPTPRQYDSRAARQKAYRERQKQAAADQLAAKGLPAAAPIPTMPSMTRWKALHDQARAALQAIQDEMQAYYDDRSEQWQESDRAQQFQEILDRVGDAYQAVDDLSVEA